MPGDNQNKEEEKKAQQQGGDKGQPTKSEEKKEEVKKTTTLTSPQQSVKKEVTPPADDNKSTDEKNTGTTPEDEGTEDKKEPVKFDYNKLRGIIKDPKVLAMMEAYERFSKAIDNGRKPAIAKAQSSIYTTVASVFGTDTPAVFREGISTFIKIFKGDDNLNLNNTARDIETLPGQVIKTIPEIAVLGEHLQTEDIKKIGEMVHLGTIFKDDSKFKNFEENMRSLIESM